MTPTCDELPDTSRPFCTVMPMTTDLQQDVDCYRLTVRSLDDAIRLPTDLADG